ncbi:MAG: divergent PAP2 family protein [Oscillospiraceae bacterium]
MQALQELLANRVLISGLVGWGAAQVLKTIIYALMHRTLDLTRIFGDGGMPSGHSATVCAVATSAGILYGLGSFRSPSA